MATGDLVVKVLSDTTQYQAGMKRAAQDARNFQNDAVAAARRSGSNSFLALEAGRLAEDLSIGYQINGLRGALQGAGNNITQMASIVSPLAGGIAGLAVAGVGIAPMLYSWATAAKDVSAEFRKLKEETDALRAAADERSKDRAAARERMGFGELDVNAVRNRKASVQDDIQANKERMDIARRATEDAMLAAGVSAPRVRKGVNSLMTGFSTPADIERVLRSEKNRDGSAVYTDEQIKAIVAAATELHGLSREAERLGVTLTELEKREKSAAAEDVESRKAGWAKEKERFDKQTEQLAQKYRDQMGAITESTMTPEERFRKSQEDAASLRRGAFFYGVPIDETAMNRKQGQELRRLAEAKGLLGPSPGMAGGALRGSAEDYRARVNAANKDPSSLLERQIRAVEKGNATQEDVKRLLQIIADSSREPEKVAEI